MSDVVLSSASTEQDAREPSARRVAIASLVGTMIEWYDFLIYGTAEDLVFNKIFFIASDPFVGTLLALASLAIGYIVRPLGGIVFGHFGDRIGRKSMLIITLMMMGISTGLIGLVPTYESIGIAAPILLTVFRILQGLAIGGEWGGAVLMAFEHAPKEKRGFYGAFPQMGLAAGIVLSSAVFLGVSYQNQEDFIAWGWRIPFLFSFVLVFVGLFMRLKVTETPAFEKLKKKKTLVKFPLVDVFKHQTKAVFMATFAVIITPAIANLVTVFSLLHAVNTLNIPRRSFLIWIMIAASIQFFMIPLFGWMSDRVGRKAVYLSACAVTVLFSFAYFPMLETRSHFMGLLAVIIAMAVCHASIYGPQAAFLSEAFAPEVRYTGVALGYQFGGMIGGALPPLLAVSLQQAAGGATWPVGMLMGGMAFVSFLTAAYLSTHKVGIDS